MLLKVCVAEPEITVFSTLNEIWLDARFPLNFPPTKFKVPIFPDPETPKFPEFKVRVVKVTLEARTLPELKVKVFPVMEVVTKGLGFPEKEPDPVMESTVKDPTERATEPEEEIDRARNLTLVKVQEAVLVRV